MCFSVGDELFWVHGEHHRIGTVIEVSKDKLLIEGSTSRYWVSKVTMKKNCSRPYPVGRGLASPPCN